MRNEERIEPILELVKERWKDSPDLRLGQLLHVVTKENDVFYVEDDRLARNLSETLDADNPFDDMDYFCDE